MQRRVWLGVAALAGIGGAGWVSRNAIARAFLTGRENEGVNLTAELGTDTCLVTPDQAEGPFFWHAPVRSDITEDRDGAGLVLDLEVIDASTCMPIRDALVEVWHCDSAGRYSGFPEELARRPFDTLAFLGGSNERVDRTNEKTYLRGAQHADSSGRVSFSTIVPGWYEPRVPHVHVKVFANGQSYLTTQLYFPQPFVDRLYGSHVAYESHGLSPYHDGNDLVLGQNPDARGLLLVPVVDGGRWRATARLALVT